MSNYKDKKKKKDKKPLIILFGFIAVFACFIWLVTLPSEQSKAFNDLEVAFNKKDVEMIWYKYKSDLYQDEIFLDAVRKKLHSFKLTNEEIKDCISWLPKAPTSINLIVVPDLSRRINDNINNPNQIRNDKIILKSIWESFVDYSKLKRDTQDRFIVEVTDKDQAKGQFDQIANDLQFDLSTHRGKINKLYFTSEKSQQFDKNINLMYASAQQKPLGADYHFYFKRYLVDNIKQPTLFCNYINKVIIITDGYLEPENKPAYTKLYGADLHSKLYKAADIGNILETINSNGLNIPKLTIDFTNTEFLICEVNERKGGEGHDFEILKTYWEDWLNRMHARKVEFIQHQQASNFTVNKIKGFIKD